MKKTIQYIFGILLLIVFCLPGQRLVAQTFEEMDYVVMNRLYDYLIEYEKTLNAEKFAQSHVKKMFYNDQIEVFNDLTDKAPSYLPLWQYLNIYDSIKSGNPEFEVFHYNLHLIKNQHRLYYDLIHIQLLKEIVDNSTFPPDEIIHIDSSNVIGSNMLNFTILYNKYDPENRFQILKIEEAGQAMIPSAWHRREIPDEIKVAIGPGFSNLGGSTGDLDIGYKHKMGFQIQAVLMNRFAGGLNYSFSWFAGLGARYAKSEWNLSSDSLRQQYGDQDFTTEILSREIAQDLSLFYLDVPIGVSAKYFPSKKWSIALNAQIKPWYLLSSDYKVNGGNIDYSGYHYEQGQEFHFTNMPDPYGFTNNTQVSGNASGVNLSNFGADAGLSLQVNYRISKTMDIFIQPGWQTNITDLLGATDSKNLYDLNIDARGVVNPLIEMTETPSFSTTSIEVGIVMKLNNVVKPFIPSFKFKEQERKTQKDNFYAYLVDKIPAKQYPPPFDKKKTKRVQIIENDEFVKYPSEVRYSHGPDLGVQKKELKTGKVNKIKALRSDIYYFKPFQYDLATKQSTTYNLNHKVLYDTLKFTDSLKKIPVPVYMSRLNDLNVFVITDMNKGERGVRGSIIDSYKEKVFKLGENQCALYFNESHGRTITEVFQEGQGHPYCFDCNNAYNSVNILEKKDQDGAAPPFGVMNELRLLINQDFNLERRNINLNYLLGNADAFITTFEDLQNIQQSNNLETAVWSEPDSDAKLKQNLTLLKKEILSTPVQIDQFKQIDLYYNPTSGIEQKVMDYYFTYIFREDAGYNRPKANTYKMLYQYLQSGEETKKSIRLRNFEFKKL